MSSLAATILRLDFRTSSLTHQDHNYSLTPPILKVLAVQLISGVRLDPEHLRSTLPGWVVVFPILQGLSRASFSPYNNTH
jgi:hypothetical protein